MIVKDPVLLSTYEWLKDITQVPLHKPVAIKTKDLKVHIVVAYIRFDLLVFTNKDRTRWKGNILDIICWQQVARLRKEFKQLN